MQRLGGIWEGAVSSGCKKKQHKGMKMPGNVQRQWGGKLEDFGVVKTSC